jgi:RNA polymerase sigma factor (sigma-70 family)
MGKYLNKPMEELAGELAGGLLRLRKGYVDAAEALLQILDLQQEYPYEFVVYRLTGFRSQRREPQPLSGRTLRSDLMQLMLDVSESFHLRADEYAGQSLDSAALAQKLEVSTKTLQRWRRIGLPARWLTFADGRRRIAFLETSVDWFIRARRQRVLRSMRFTQMTRWEREDILRRARRMANFTRCTLSEVSRRLAGRTGRAVETIRYTIRRNDLQNPQKAIFPYLSAPLDAGQKEIIYRCFLHGVSVPTLAKKYGRTRGSVYRIINEMRARQLVGRPIGFMYNPQFDLPGADETILGDVRHMGRGARKDGDGDTMPSSASHTPADLPPYLRSLYDVPLLTAQQEREIFRRYNYLKYKADRLRRQIDLNRIRTTQLKQIEALLLQANAVKNEIIRANLRLVVSISKKHLGGPQTLFELISDGNVSLMKAAEKFDYSRGNRFSTYASWAIMRNFARTVPHERYQLDRFETGQEDVLDVAAGMRAYDPNEVNLPELRESIDVVLAQLTPRERAILIDHYGLDDKQPAKTLDQLGKNLGISKERVRQIEIAALQKLRRILNPQESDLLS